MRTYYIDGRVFYERIIDEKKISDGIITIRKLPTETIDYVYDNKNGEFKYFVQFLNSKATENDINNFDKIKDDKNIVIFHPAQIGFINTGVYGKTKKEILGYLEKSKIPYNQLKLLETSVIIYRLVRSPERLVFKIDTGDMPLNKGLKHIENIKRSLSKKQTFDASTGRLLGESNILSMLENFYIPVGKDGRGSSIETIGGNAKGFTELDDIYYFSRKLYRALKYPMSRVTAREEKRDGEITFTGQNFGEISRDEIKWAKFLEKQIEHFTDEFTKLFLLHLEFKGLRKQYGLNLNSFRVVINPPNNYKAQMEQKILDAKFQNYTALKENSEFSKYYLMKTYLNMSDDDIEENYKGFLKDRELTDKYKNKKPGEEETSDLAGGLGGADLGGADLGNTETSTELPPEETNTPETETPEETPEKETKTSPKEKGEEK